MKRKLAIVGLAFTLLVVPLTRLTVQAQSGAADAQTTKVKAEVAKRVANKKTKVKVKLRSGQEVKVRLINQTTMDSPSRRTRPTSRCRFLTLK